MTEQDYKFYLNEGIDKTNQGKFEEALEVLEKALQLNPQNALIYFSKAIAYHNLNRLRAACENYDKAIKLDNKMIDAYYNKAQAILAFEDKTESEYLEALGLLEKATDLDEKFIDAHYYSAVVKKQLGKYESAIVSLDKVLEIEPQAPYSRALKKLIQQKYL
ncbi:tetratricopeptide repeat protein [bacterium]|nr:tetratricopeptide repeat protein [bacterium]